MVVVLQRHLRTCGQGGKSLKLRTSLAVMATAAVLTLSLHGQAPRDCEPKRDCTVTRTCEQRQDTRDCSTEGVIPPCVKKVDDRNCDPQWSCPDCTWFDVGCQGNRMACLANRESYRRGCEATKAAQNAIYASEFAACREAAKQMSADDIAKAQVNCENEKAAQNTLYAAEFSKCQSEAALARGECERVKAREREECEAGLRGPFSCNAVDTVGRLGKTKIEYVDLAAVRTRWLTSPPSASEGWLDTACVAEGAGTPYRDAVLSSDGFWTIDVHLNAFSIDDVKRPAGLRYVRILIRPPKWGGGRAHVVANEHYITPRDRIRFAGPVLIERTSAGEVLVVQPVDDLSVLAMPGPASPR